MGRKEREDFEREKLRRELEREFELERDRLRKEREDFEREKLRREREEFEREKREHADESNTLINTLKTFTSSIQLTAENLQRLEMQSVVRARPLTVSEESTRTPT